MVLVLFAVLTAVGVFVVAAVAVGAVTGELAARPPMSVYDLDEAVEVVGDLVPPEVAASVSYDDVRAVLTAHLDYLRRKGVASDATPGAPGKGVVLVPDDEPVAFVLGRVAAAKLDITDDEVLAILDAEQAYYEQIGAIGAEVQGPEV